MQMSTLKTIGAAAAAISLTLAGAAPTAAASIGQAGDQVVSSAVVPAAYKGGMYRRGNNYYFNGYRGYHQHRHGYREYNGVWFPLAAFGAGAILGGALAAPPPPPAGGGNAHVDWCYAHYRSYRAYDNTYQPLNGPRRPCYSPYG
jgi:hypothetical protein